MSINEAHLATSLCEDRAACRGVCFAGSTGYGDRCWSTGCSCARRLVAAYDHRLNVVTTTTDEEGAFALTTPGGNRVRLHAIPPDDSGLAEELSSGEWALCSARTYGDGAVLTWPLRDAATIQGRLLSSAGSPVTDGVVTAVPILPTDLPLVAASTDQAGDFLLTGLHPGAGGVQLRFESDTAPRQFLGGTYEESEAELTALSEGRVADVGSLVLLAGITVGRGAWARRPRRDG